MSNDLSLQLKQWFKVYDLTINSSNFLIRILDSTGLQFFNELTGGHDIAELFSS